LTFTANCYAADFEPSDIDVIELKIIDGRETAIVYLSTEDRWGVWANGSVVGSVSTQADAEAKLREHAKAPGDARIMYTNGMPSRTVMVRMQSVTIGYGAPQCAGGFCFVGPGWLAIPGAGERWKTPLNQIDKLEYLGDAYLGINLRSGFVTLECESDADRDDLAFAISKLAGVNVWNGWERVRFAKRR
jgi:hypothetical protein